MSTIQLQKLVIVRCCGQYVSSDIWSSGMFVAANNWTATRYRAKAYNPEKAKLVINGLRNCGKIASVVNL